jgi:hypothetical protein
MHRTQNPTAPAADTDNGPVVTPADVLHGAARYLELHGWTNSQYYHHGTESTFPPACVDGAIAMAAFGHTPSLPLPTITDDPVACVDFYRAADWLLNHLTIEGLTTTFDRLTHRCAAGCLDCHELGDLFRWNDQPGQTSETVIATLRSAADEYDWQHACEEDLETYGENELDNDRVPTREGFLAWLAARR